MVAEGILVLLFIIILEVIINLLSGKPLFYFSKSLVGIIIGGSIAWVFLKKNK